MLYIKNIRRMDYIYWSKEPSTNPISLGWGLEVIEIINFVKKSKFKNKSIVIDTLDVLGRYNLANFLRNGKKYILSEVSNYETKYH